MVNTVEDKPRKQRDAHYEKVIAQRKRLRNQIYEDALGMGNLGFNLGLAQKPTTDKLDQLQRQFAAAYEKKKIEQPSAVANIPPPGGLSEEEFRKYMRDYEVVFQDDLATESESENTSASESENTSASESEEKLPVDPDENYQNYLGLEYKQFDYVYTQAEVGDNLSEELANVIDKDIKKLGGDRTYGLTTTTGGLKSPVLGKLAENKIIVSKGPRRNLIFTIDNYAFTLNTRVWVLMRAVNPYEAIRKYRGQLQIGKEDIKIYQNALVASGTPVEIKPKGGKLAAKWETFIQPIVQSASSSSTAGGAINNVFKAAAEQPASSAFSRGVEQAQTAMDPCAGRVKGRHSKKTPGIKLDSENRMGDVHVDIPKLRAKFKLVVHKNGKTKITEQLTKKEAEDLDALLTRRLNKKRTYSGKALTLLERIRSASNVPVIGSSKLTEKARIGSATYKYYDNEDLVNRLKILMASREAGNNTNEVMSELTAILDVLMNRDVLSAEEYRQVLDK